MADPYKKAERKIAVTLFLAALALYTPGIWWGLPHATAPNRILPWGSDELAPLGPIAELYSVFLARNPTFNPQYPLFHYGVQALAVGPYVVYLWATGRLTQPSPTYPYGLSDPVSALAVMTLLARSVSLLMAAGVVVIAYKTAAILWDRRAGVIAGVLVLLMYPMFYYSRTSNTDMGALFWTSLGLFVFAACLRDSLTSRRAVWLGVYAALAMATKDASYSVFLVAVLVLLAWHFRHRLQLGSRWQQVWMPLLAGLLAGSCVYAVASGVVLHPGRYWSHVSFITHGSSARSHFYFSTPPSLAGYLDLLEQTVTHLIDAMGAPMIILALAGLVLCFFRAPQVLPFALPAIGVLTFVVLPVRFVLFRFVVVMAYVLTFFGAYTLSSAWNVRRAPLRKLALPLLAAVCSWSSIRGADLTYQMIHDSRYEVGAWLRQHARAGDRVGYYGAAQKLPPLDPGVLAVQAESRPPTVPGPPEEAPEFVAVIPQQHFEKVHEWSLPDDVYRALDDGSLGYQRVFAAQTRSLFAKRPVSFVNPAAQVFMRKDLLARMTASKNP